MLILNAALASVMVGAQPSPSAPKVAIEVVPEDIAWSATVPANRDPDEKLPVILFLHGWGECGCDAGKARSVGIGPAAAEHPERWPFIIVYPQKPDFDAQWDDYVDQTLAALDEAIVKLNGDPERVSLTGLSQGGHGCWAFLRAAPERFNAVVAVCAYADAPTGERPDRAWRFDPESDFVRDIVKAAGDKPIRIYHGTDDDVVPPEQAEGMYKVLKEAGADVELHMLDGVNHGAWVPAYADPAVPGLFLKAGE